MRRFLPPACENFICVMVMSMFVMMTMPVTAASTILPMIVMMFMFVMALMFVMLMFVMLMLTMLMLVMALMLLQ